MCISSIWRVYQSEGFFVLFCLSDGLVKDIRHQKEKKVLTITPNYLILITLTYLYIILSYSHFLHHAYLLIYLQFSVIKWAKQHSSQNPIDVKSDEAIQI
jgi:hypothetical protein